MKANYARPCRVCSKPVKVGIDEYEPSSKTSVHLECKEQEADHDEARALVIAVGLGYLNHAEALATDWPVFLLSHGSGIRTAGRLEPATRGLFDSVHAMPAGAEE